MAKCAGKNLLWHDKKRVSDLNGIVCGYFSMTDAFCENLAIYKHVHISFTILPFVFKLKFGQRSSLKYMKGIHALPAL